MKASLSRRTCCIFLNHRHNWGLTRVTGLTGDKTPTAGCTTPWHATQIFCNTKTGAAAPRPPRFTQCKWRAYKNSQGLNPSTQRHYYFPTKTSDVDAGGGVGPHNAYAHRDKTAAGCAALLIAISVSLSLGYSSVALLLLMCDVGRLFLGARARLHTHDSRSASPSTQTRAAHVYSRALSLK